MLKNISSSLTVLFLLTKIKIDLFLPCGESSFSLKIKLLFISVKIKGIIKIALVILIFWLNLKFQNVSRIIDVYRSSFFIAPIITV